MFHTNFDQCQFLLIISQRHVLSSQKPTPNQHLKSDFMLISFEQLQILGIYNFIVFKSSSSNYYQQDQTYSSPHLILAQLSFQMRNVQSDLPNVPQTRVKLQTSYQESYLEDHNQRTTNYSPQKISYLTEKIMEAEAELDLLKATHQFLLKQMGGKPRRPKEQLIATASEYLQRARAYAQSQKKLQLLAQKED